MRSATFRENGKFECLLWSHVNSCKKSSLKGGKDSGCESEGLHCVYGQKDNRIYGLKAGKTSIFENAYKLS